MKREKRLSVYRLLPIIFILAVIPLIVRLKVIPLNGVVDKNWIGNKNVDYYSYFKAILMMIATLFSLVLFTVYKIRYKTKIKNTYYYIPMIIYTLFVVLSSVLSEYMSVAIRGFPDRYEGMLILLAYMTILFITINIVNSEKSIKILMIALIISTIIVGLIGIFQYFGLNFFNSDIAKFLISPVKYRNRVNFDSEPYRIATTLYNSNYVGSYMVMSFILSYVGYILVKKRRDKLLLGIVNLLMYVNLIGCRSRAGLVGAFVSLIFLLFLLRKYIHKNMKYIFAMIVMLIAVFLVMNYVSDGSLAGKYSSLRQEAGSIVGKKAPGKLKDIKIDKKRLSIYTVDKELHLYLEGNDLIFKDSQGAVLKYAYLADDNKFIFKDKSYSDFKFNYYPDSNVLKFEYNGKEINFKVKKDGFWIIGLREKLFRTKGIESWGFKNKERLGSGRGFIWSRSLPLLKDTIILGFGPDTFPLYFPQSDYVGKLLGLGHTLVLVDKPHNMYLQIAINTGVISLLAILTLFAMYFFSSFKLYWDRNFEDIYSIVGVGIFLAFIGYAVTGFFNDSVVSVAPVFWVLLGIGISINMKLKRRENN